MTNNYLRVFDDNNILLFIKYPEILFLKLISLQMNIVFPLNFPKLHHQRELYKFIQIIYICLTIAIYYYLENIRKYYP